MHSSLRLACLLLLASCGPKTDPIGPLDGPVDPEDGVGSAGAAGTDGGAFRWEADFAAIDPGDDLAGRSVRATERDGWETRSTSGAARMEGRASSAEGGIPSIAYDELDTFADHDLRAEVAEVAVATPRTGRMKARKAGVGASYAMPAAPPPEAEPSPAMDLPTAEAGEGGYGGGASGRTRSVDRAARVLPSQPALKAGTTDDNAHFDAWLTYVGEWGARGDIAGWADTLDVSGRRHVQVLDARGRPVPDARVSIFDPVGERVVWAGRAYGDGRVPLYPRLKVPGRDLDIAGDAPEGGWTVQASTPDGAVRTVQWDGQSEELDLVVDTAGLKVGAPVPVDVCFIIDTTGSMGDELARIKSTLLSVTDKLRADAAQGVDLRYGAVLYRDIGDEYVTRRHAFTTDLTGFDRALQSISAAGGGDGPESLNQGLAVGVAGMEWREGAARVAFVIADAPPHMDYQEEVTYGRAAAAAVHRGIRVHTVAASGLDDRGSYAFRQVAQLTRGQFIYIEYGSAAASAADHGVSAPAGSNNLDDIVYGRVRAEIDGWGRDGAETVARR